MFIISIVLLMYSGTQTFIANYILADISNKTNHELSLSSIDINIKKGIEINNIFIEDSNKDTLIYANKINIHLNLLDYFSDNMSVTDIEIDNTIVKITSDNDSIFNFQYIIDEFTSDNSSKNSVKDTSESVLPINLNNINIILDNVNFVFISKTSGIDLQVRNVDLALNTDTIDIFKMKYYADNIDLRNAYVGIEMFDTPSSTENTETSKLVLGVGANKISLENIKFSFKDLTDSMYIYSEVSNGEILPKLVDIPNQRITANSINLKRANTAVIFDKKEYKQEITDTTVNNILRIIPQINWYFACNNTIVESSYFSFDDNSTKNIKKEFDYNHILFTNINSNISEAKMNDDLISAKINNISTNSKNNFTLKQFKGEASIKKNNIYINNFLLQTPNSNINGVINLKYKSFNNFINNNFEIDTTEIHINDSRISIKDINYFYKIDTINIIKENTLNDIQIALNINGNSKKLNFYNTKLHTLSNSSLYLNGNISNYTDTSKIAINTNIELLKTTEDDINMFLKKPIKLPRYILISGEAKYSNDSTFANLDIKSELGETKISSNIKDKKYNINLELINNNLSALLDSTIIKDINLKLKAQGTGFNINNDIALDIVIDSIQVNNQKLRNITFNTTGSSDGYNVKLISNNKLFDINLESNIFYKDSNLIADINSDVNNISLKSLGILKAQNDISFKTSGNIIINNNTNYTSNINISNFKNINKDNTSNLKYVYSTINITDSNSTVNLNSDILTCDIESNYNILKSKNVFYTYFKYFFSDTDTIIPNKTLDFKIKINDKKLIESNIVDGLVNINTTPISGNFVSNKNIIQLNTQINKLVYDDYILDTFNIDISTTDTIINYNTSLNSLTIYDSIKVDLLSVNGIISNDTATFIFTNKEDEKIKYNLGLYYSKINNINSYVGMLPNLIIDSLKFDSNKQNRVLISKNNFNIENFELSNNEQKIYIKPTNNTEELTLFIENIKLSQFSGKYIYERDLISGLLNGEVIFNSKGFLKSNLNIDNFILLEEELGKLNIEADFSKKTKNYNILLSDNNSMLNLKGKITKEKNIPSYDLTLKDFEINKFQYFLKKGFSKLHGKINGKLSYNKKFKGKINIDDVRFRTIIRNSMLYINDQTITVENNNLILKNFSVKDSLNNLFTVSGRINNLSLTNFDLDLKMDIKDFLIYDVINNNINPLYGKVILDNYSTIKGNINKIIINSDIKLKKGTELTYVYPQNQMANEISTEGIVEFTSISDSLNPHNQLDTLTQNWVSMFEVNSTIKIDKNTKFNLIFDKNSGEGLNIEGGADLALNINNNGIINLVGNYTVEEGFYDISYYNIVGRKFTIQKGSKISWMGDPINPTTDLTAKYKIKAHPYPLMVNTTSTNSSELNKYKTAETFYVSLNITKELLEPEMRFKIIYPRLSENSNNPDLRARINQINDDEALANKQAMSLLVIGGFVTDDGNYIEGGNTVINNSVSSILTGQLNNISDKYMKGVDFDVDVDSRSNYNSDGNVNNTQTDVKLKMKKYLFKNRVVLEVAGGVTVNENNANAQNDAGLQDAAVEYLITEDGKYKLRAFSQKDYSTINQDVQETGISFIFTTDFDRVKDLFKKTSIEKQ